MRFRMESITPKIWLMVYPTIESMARALIRISEYYESPRFRGRTGFTVADYKAWCKEEGRKFTFYKDWRGFNLPVRDLAPFRDGLFDPLSRAEKAVLKACAKLPKNAYVIAVAARCRKSPGLIDHELAHGLYALDRQYRRDVRQALRGVDLTEVHKELDATRCYHPAVRMDETQAYVVSNDLDSVRELPRSLRPQMLQIFREALRRHGVRR